jgi:ubiquinone biosynthesis UbiH/UbiF/VisC/COQ6 family hydroxylase
VTHPTIATGRTTASNKATPVAVAGGGIVAGCAARLMAEAGHDVLWLGPQEPAQRADGADQRAYALGPQAIGLLSRLGLWQGLKPKARPITRMEIRQTNDRRGITDPQKTGPTPTNAPDLCLKAEDLGEDWLACMVSHADLLAATESFKDWPKNLHRVDASVVQVRPGGPNEPVVLNLSNNQAYTASLLLAADGQRSTVRRRLGLGWGVRQYQQTALVCRLDCQKPHESVALQWFEQGAVLALLPLVDPHQVSLVYSLPNERLAHFQSLADDAFANALSLASAYRLGELSSPSPRVASPLAMTLVPETSLGRVLLLGDAAHTVHPLAGYGLNLGFQDLLAFDVHVKQRLGRGHKDLGEPSMLTQFAAQRRQSVHRVQWGLDGLWRLIQPGPGLLEVSRQLGLRAIHKMGPLRHQLIQLALQGA